VVQVFVEARNGDSLPLLTNWHDGGIISTGQIVQGRPVMWLRIVFHGKGVVRWLNLSVVSDAYIDYDENESRASLYMGSEVMLALSGNDAEIQVFDDRDAAVFMKWDLDRLGGTGGHTVMRRSSRQGERDS
jgi:hypothetical protein